MEEVTNKYIFREAHHWVGSQILVFIDSYIKVYLLETHISDD